MSLRFPRQSVPSGSFTAGTRKKEILEAYLGSCVGVAVWDKEAGVGGIGHFLLPEPSSTNRLWQDGSYAATGLPRFLEEMAGQGASTERMEACIAGGALVGPISEMDLELDIGGRTTDVVEEILHKKGIHVREEETGGFFSCRLSLDLETLEPRIDPLGPERFQTGTPPAPITGEQLEKAMNSVQPIPQIALKIIRMIRQQSYDMEDLAEETRSDQVISAKVIRLCNSARFGMKTDAIDRALVMVGEKRLLQFILAAALEGFFPENEQGYSLCKGGLYKHAMGTATASEIIANFTGRASADIAYTAGLLHDIGKVVLDQYVSSVAPLFYRRVQSEATNLRAVEHEVFGISHDVAGGLLAERWSLPGTLADVIRHHHQPEDAQVDPDLNRVVSLADLLMSRFMAGQEMEILDPRPLGPRLESLGIAPEQLSVLLEQMPWATMFEHHAPAFDQRKEIRSVRAARQRAGRALRLRAAG